MAEFKVVINEPKTGKSIQKVVSEPNAKNFLGKRIGETVKGEMIDMTGYEFEITGGSDIAGFPMRKDLPGIGRKRLLIGRGHGLKDNTKGLRKRRTTCGNTIHDKIAQISMKVTKAGNEPLPEMPPKEKK